MKSMIYHCKNNIEDAVMDAASYYQLVAHARFYIMVPFHISWEQLPGMTNQTTDRNKSGDYHS